jgi:hypothetical protein
MEEKELEFQVEGRQEGVTEHIARHTVFWVSHRNLQEIFISATHLQKPLLPSSEADERQIE